MPILAKVRDLQSEIKKPLNVCSRILLTYNCFDVSEKFIAIAGLAGGLYLYNRDPCVFYQLLPFTDGVINKISISPNEKWVVFTTTESILRLVSITPDPDKTPYTDLLETRIKLSEKLSEFVWGSDSSKIFIGDALGRVQIITIKVFNRTVLSTLKIILELDSSIVQMSNFSDYLLISTMTQTFISNLRAEQYNQVGLRSHSRALGVCFLKPIKSNEEPKIYCARPGSKLWSVDIKGHVKCTYLFKESLTVSPTKVYNANEESDVLNRKSPHSYHPKAVSFPRLLPIDDSQLFTFTENSFYILNPNGITNGVVLWNNEFSIKDAKIINNNIYVLGNDELIELKLLTVPELLVDMYNKKKYDLCDRICSYFADVLMLPTTDFKYLSCVIDLDEKCTLSAATSYLIKKIIFEIDKLTWNTHVLSKGARAPFPPNRLLKNDFDYQFLVDYNMHEIHEFDNQFLIYCNQVENLNIQENSSVPQDINNTETISSQNAPTNVDFLTGYQPGTADELHNLKRIMKKMVSNPYISHNNPLTFEDEIINILNEYSMSELFHILVRFGMNVIDKGMAISDASTKCSMLFLYYLTKNAQMFDETVCRKYVSAFLIVCETGRGISCTCGYPIPRHNPKPLYYDVSEKLIIHLLKKNELWYTIQVCRHVPHMWYMLMDLITINSNNLIDVINISLQSNYKPGFTKCLKFITINVWKKIIKAKLQVENGLCLICDTNFSKKTTDIDESRTISWTYLGKCMVDSIGGSKTIELLADASQEIPVGSFMVEFYQYCILKVNDDNGKNDQDFSQKKIIEDDNQNQEEIQETFDFEDKIVKAGYVPRRIYKYKCADSCICKKVPILEHDDDNSKKNDDSNDNDTCSIEIGVCEKI